MYKFMVRMKRFGSHPPIHAPPSLHCITLGATSDPTSDSDGLVSDCVKVEIVVP